MLEQPPPEIIEMVGEARQGQPSQISIVRDRTRPTKGPTSSKRVVCLSFSTWISISFHRPEEIGCSQPRRRFHYPANNNGAFRDKALFPCFTMSEHGVEMSLSSKILQPGLGVVEKTRDVGLFGIANAQLP